MKSSLFRLIVLATATACVSLPLAAQSSYAINRVVTPIDETNLVQLRGNVHPMAQARYDRGPAPEATPTGRIMLVLQRSATQQQTLTQYLSDLQNPSSASYHKWLTPAQYGAKFGLSDADLQTVEGWLQSHGFKIEKVPQARNVIQFSGNFGQIESAFHTSMHVLSVNGESHFANMTDPQIPAALAAVVAGVGPLNDFHPKPPLVTGMKGHFDASKKRIVPDFTLEDTSGDLYLFADPADASTIYDTPNSNLNANFTGGTSYDGTGINLGIVGSSDVNTDDLTNYRTGFLGETTANANIPTMVVDGADPGLVLGWSTEGLLDNEVAGGLAPKAKIYFYTAADTDLTSGFLDATYRALDDNTVSILSMSIEECEAGLGTAGNEEVMEGEEQGAAQGITVVVAAGDNGSAGCDDFDSGTQALYGFNVNGFASTPYAVAVGGTDYDVLTSTSSSFGTYVNDTSSGAPPYYGTALSYIPENPWNDSTSVNGLLSANVANASGGSTNIVAGSGGFSSCAALDSSGSVCTEAYGVPDFQTGLAISGGVTNSNSVRMIPDVSFLAGNGVYSAMWVVCSDPASDGSTQSYTECVNTNGVFSPSTEFEGVGGTSAAAPAFAGMLALVAEAKGSSSDNYRLGQVDPVLYNLAANGTTYASVFHDVKVGNNSVVCASGSPNCGTNGFMTGYNAGAGYDLATGLGSVDVSALVKNWGNASFASTTTTLDLNGSTAAYSGPHGANVAFKVGVTPTSAAGSVAVIDTANETSGGTAQGPQNNGQLVISLGGTDTANYNGLPGGTYTVYARYGGSDTDAASSSTPISVTISPENSTTALAVNAYSALTGNSISSTTIPYGAQVNLDATISGTNASETTSGTQGLATGTVTFDNGSSALGTANVSVGNLASWPPLSNSFTVLPAGSYSVTAAYSGDASFNKSTSAASPFTVAKATTQSSASASPSSISASGSATVSLTITTPYSYAVVGYGALPTGTVTLTGNGGTLATVNLSSLTGTLQSSSPYNYVLTGTATVSGSGLASGSNTITATYSGDANYAGSNATTSVTVTASPAITLTSGGNVSVAAGSTATTSLSVAPANGFTGAVQFTCTVSSSPAGLQCTAPNTTVSGTASASSTLTVTTTSSTPTGSYTATVVASDVATGKVTSQATVTVTVTTGGGGGNPAIALSNSGAITVNAGATTGNTSTVTVTPSGGFTGAVNLTCAVTTSISNPNDPPTCGINTSPVTITGTTAGTATLTIATTAPSTSTAVAPLGKFFLGGGATLAMLFFFGVPARRRAWRTTLGVMALSVMGILFVAGTSGCGSSGGTQTTIPGTTTGEYTATVTGTDAATGKITGTTTVSITVN